jgi:hypothetical protein
VWGDRTAIDQQEAQRQAIRAGLLKKRSGKQGAKTILKEGLEAREFAIPTAVEHDPSGFAQTRRPEFTVMRAIRAGAAGE